jgi:hypothetical protein
LNTGKYLDKNTYRFVLQSGWYVHTSSSGSGGTVTTTSWDFHFYDRLNDKKYSNSGAESGWPAKSLEKIVQKITQKFQ